MTGYKLYIKHLFASFVFLFILVNTIFVSSDFIKSFLENPHFYFQTDLSTEDFHFAFILILLIVVAVLLSYVFYLILTFRTRFELEIWNATRSLASSKEQFKKLYESAPVPYILLDKKALINNSNKSALRFFGVFPEDVEGKNLFSFVSPDSDESPEQLFQYYKSDLPINRKEVQIITKNGITKTVLLSIFKITVFDKSTSTGLAMIFDITEQKLLDKQKTEFVSLASHQLKTPLATAKWYTEMLISGDIGELQPKQKEYVERLHLANKDMVDLVDTLLNVSRIEMGTLAIEKKSTNVEELTESILEEVSPEIIRKNIQIQREYNSHLKDIQSDPKLLRIVIHNLLTNAIKYTGNGGIVRIAFEETFDNKQIIISDNGIGIPEEAKDKIFTKMYRAENVTKLENSQGTGLGLYLIKSIMTSMGGEVGFESEENKGSIFTITL